MAREANPAQSSADLERQVAALLWEHNGYKRAAVLLREHGWTISAIARRLDAGRTAVRGWLDPAVLERRRELQRGYREARNAR